MAALKEQFEIFVGRLVKDPQRMSADICPVSQELEAAASEAGLMLSFEKVSESPDFNLISTPVCKLNVQITKEGVPEDQAGWAWRIESVEPDNI